MIIIAITNQKGGVGKTTLSINISAGLAKRNYRTLLVDMDPQANATDGLGKDSFQIPFTIYHCLLKGLPLHNIILTHYIDNLFIAPSNIKLARAQTDLAKNQNEGLFRLRQLLYEEKDKYHYVIIDCPPSLGLLTINAILASTDIIIPIEPNSYALKGMSMLLRTIIRVKDNFHHHPNFLGVVINNCEVQSKLHKAIINNIEEFFSQSKVFKTRLDRDPLIPQAEVYSQSIWEYSPASPSIDKFHNLVEEIIEKTQGAYARQQS